MLDKKHCSIKKENNIGKARNCKKKTRDSGASCNDYYYKEDGNTYFCRNKFASKKCAEKSAFRKRRGLCLPNMVKSQNITKTLIPQQSEIHSYYSDLNPELKGSTYLAGIRMSGSGRKTKRRKTKRRKTKRRKTKRI